jgi:hypothetical protein
MRSGHSCAGGWGNIALYIDETGIVLYYGLNSSGRASMADACSDANARSWVYGLSHGDRAIMSPTRTHLGATTPRPSSCPQRPADAADRRARTAGKIAIPCYSLLRRIKSLFGRNAFRVPIGREFASNILELLIKFMPERGGWAEKSQIPCYFPCSQGIHHLERRNGRACGILVSGLLFMICSINDHGFHRPE